MAQRPHILEGRTMRYETPCGSYFITVNIEDDKIFEVIGNIAKPGACANATSSTITRLVSSMFQNNQEWNSISKKLIGVSCVNDEGDNGFRRCCVHCLGLAINETMKWIEERKT